MTVFDCYVLGYCITHSNCTWDIRLSSCCIGDDEVEGLVQGALEHPVGSQAAISKLYLSRNSVTSAGVKHLLKLPKHVLTSLMTLDLSLNPIGNGGSAPLIRTLSTLNFLTLYSTVIGVEDCRALSELLLSASGLETLEIRNNDLPPEAVELIIRPLQLDILFLGRISSHLWVGRSTGKCK